MDITVNDRREIAARCEIEEQYLYQILSRRRTCSPELCVRIERESKGAVMRRDLRPDDWHLIWPELIERPDAPKESRNGA